jgi:hypothetical protein
MQWYVLEAKEREWQIPDEIYSASTCTKTDEKILCGLLLSILIIFPSSRYCYYFYFEIKKVNNNNGKW